MAFLSQPTGVDFVEAHMAAQGMPVSKRDLTKNQPAWSMSIGRKSCLEASFV